MRLTWMVLLIVFLVIALAACQSNAPPTLIPETIPAQIDTPESLPDTPQSATLTAPTESSTMESSDPSISPQFPDMPPDIPPNDLALKMVALVREHLSQMLNISVDQIVVLDITPVVWRDAGLGCPKPGVDYIQVETPGYNILLEVGGETYTYHTDETKRFVQCNQ